MQLFSSLFQCILPSQARPSPSSEGRAGSLKQFTAFIPRAAQVKAENCSALLEHTDRASTLSSSLQLVYLSCKCGEAGRGGGGLPDSHLTGQLSGLEVRPGRGEGDTPAAPVVSLARFQVLLQKDGGALHTDTQLHQLTGRYTAALQPWLAPASWLVRTLAEQRRAGQANGEAQGGGLLAGLQHQHQLDAWNSDLVIECGDQVGNSKHCIMF